MFVFLSRIFKRHVQKMVVIALSCTNSLSDVIRSNNNLDIKFDLDNDSYKDYAHIRTLASSHDRKQIF